MSAGEFVGQPEEINTHYTKIRVKTVLGKNGDFNLLKNNVRRMGEGNTPTIITSAPHVWITWTNSREAWLPKKSSQSWKKNSEPTVLFFFLTRNILIMDS